MLTSRPQAPLPWGWLLSLMAVLWLAPIGAGGVALALAMPVAALAGGSLGESLVIGLGFLGYALIASPLFSWIGWLLALLPTAFALRQGWFGWASAALIGGAAGAVAGKLTDIELALPFGLFALLLLRLILGRLLPL